MNRRSSVSWQFATVGQFGQFGQFGATIMLQIWRKQRWLLCITAIPLISRFTMKAAQLVILSNCTRTAQGSRSSWQTNSYPTQIQKAAPLSETYLSETYWSSEDVLQAKHRIQINASTAWSGHDLRRINLQSRTRVGFPAINAVGNLKLVLLLQGILPVFMALPTGANMERPGAARIQKIVRNNIKDKKKELNKRRHVVKAANWGDKKI